MTGPSPHPMSGDGFMRRILVVRMGEPDETATVVLFLSQPRRVLHDGQPRRR